MPSPVWSIYLQKEISNSTEVFSLIPNNDLKIHSHEFLNSLEK